MGASTIVVEHVLTHAEYDKGEVETMSAARGIVVDEKAYRKLLSKVLPRVIRTDEENERYLAQLEALHERPVLTPEEERIAELLTLLIPSYEEKTYKLRPASPIDVVRHLMESNGLKQ